MSTIIQILILIISLILSIVGGFLAKDINTAILIFITIEFLNLLYYLYTINFEQRRDRDFWRSYDEESAKIANMNNYYSNILKDSHGKNDLFVSYAKKEIDYLTARLKDAAENKIMRISTDYIIYTEGVFDAFNITDNKILKLTWPIKSAINKIFAAQPDARFFETTIKMLNNKRISQIQVLVVLEEEELLSKDIIKKFLAFLSSNPGFECRYILESTFISICNSNGMITPTLDLGIYGPKMMFMVEKSSTNEYQGVYTKDEEQVRLCTRVFDETWNSESFSNANPETSNGATFNDIKNI